MKRIAVAAALAACSFIPTPAQASTRNVYYAAGVMYAASCMVMNGDLTAEQSGIVVTKALREEGLPWTYSQRADVKRVSMAKFRQLGCAGY